MPTERQPSAELESYITSLKTKVSNVDGMVKKLDGLDMDKFPEAVTPGPYKLDLLNRFARTIQAMRSFTEKGKVSLRKLNGYQTELRMDHNNGQKKSDRLTAFLGQMGLLIFIKKIDLYTVPGALHGPYERMLEGAPKYGNPGSPGQAVL